MFRYWTKCWWLKWIGDWLCEWDLQLSPHNGEEPGYQGRLPGRADGVKNSDCRLLNVWLHFWSLFLCLNPRRYCPRCALFWLIGWYKNTLDRARQLLEHSILRLVSTSSSTCCRRLFSALLLFWTGYINAWDFVSKTSNDAPWSVLLYPIASVSVGSNEYLSGTFKRRLPASVARNFSWWELPVCSSRPSMQHYIS